MIKRQAFMGKIKPGMEEEYIRRHEEIWPELVEVYRKISIRNLTCFLRGNELFGYYELDEELFSSAEPNPIEEKWDTYMNELMDEDDNQQDLVEVFHLD